MQLYLHSNSIAQQISQCNHLVAVQSCTIADEAVVMSNDGVLVLVEHDLPNKPFTATPAFLQCTLPS